MKHKEWAIELATVVAKRSKDPSTQVGAVIFDVRGRVISAGFNGLPVGVEDTDERLTNRDVKYRMIRHAEANALAFAAGSMVGATLVVTHPCCAQCAGDAIQHGIAEVVYPEPSAEMRARWADDFEISRQMFDEAGVRVIEVKDDQKT